jgi:tRNA (guanine-N7-)-methyltransferase
MSEKFRRPQINLTKDLKYPNEYTTALDGELRDYAFNEERAATFQGRWRGEVFKVADQTPVDLEIGTGNGLHFFHQTSRHPDRCLVGLELKYKPLIQTIRRCVKHGFTNARICRYHAFNVDLMFGKEELNDIFIHFPDPWVTPRKPKSRFVNARVLDLLWERQRPGATLEFKTDSREYFLWSMEQIRESKYKIEFETLNLHQSERASTNFITQFERIFMRQGIEINYVLLRKPE